MYAHRGRPASIGRHLGKLTMIKLGIAIAPRYLPRQQYFRRGGAAGQSGTYKVVWRNGQDVGAKFVSAVTQNA